MDRIRKLTPRESWRLMGFSDEDFDKAQAQCSNTQLYKQAGNSIVVNVLEAIFNQFFNQTPNSYQITKPVRLIELFAGIGAQAKALQNLGVDFEKYRMCEIDKFCIKAYNAVHGTDFPISDITKLSGIDLGIVDPDQYEYILTYSFPCQDLARGGRREGMSKGQGTRSGLLWEVERLLNETEHLPQVLVMENVKNVHNKANIKDFNLWIDYLKSKGYSSFWRDLKAQDYGMPQDRKRCFMVSILGDENYIFPSPIELTTCLKDYLETNVDEKFYLSEERLKSIAEWQQRQIERGNNYRFEPTYGEGLAKVIQTVVDRPGTATYIKERVDE